MTRTLLLQHAELEPGLVADQLRAPWRCPDQLDPDVADPGDGVDEELDAAYRAKYRRYSPNIVNSVLTPQAKAATVKLVPR